MLGAVLGRVCICLTSTGDDTVKLSVDTVDPHHVCVVQASISCSGYLGSEGSKIICVDTKILAMCLKNASSHHAIEISGKDSVADITVRCLDLFSGESILTFVVSTYDQEPDALPLDEIEFDITTEVSIPEMKKLIKPSQFL